MGLVTGLLTLPLAPVRGAFWVIGQVADEAQRRYTDPEPIRKQLAALYADYRDGVIDEAEFDRREDELLDELEARGAGRPTVWGGEGTEESG